MKSDEEGEEGEEDDEETERERNRSVRYASTATSDGESRKGLIRGKTLPSAKRRSFYWPVRIELFVMLTLFFSRRFLE